MNIIAKNRALKMVLFIIGSFLLLPSCKNDFSDEDSLSKSKKTIKGFVNDARKNVDFKDVMRRYYYEPEEILNNELFYQFFEAEYIYLKENLKKNNRSEERRVGKESRIR